MMHYTIGDMIAAQYHEQYRPPAPLIYSVDVRDIDGDNFLHEIGNVNFNEAKFASEEEAIKEFEQALARHKLEHLYPPVKATVVKHCWTTKIEERQTTKYVNVRP